MNTYSMGLLFAALTIAAWGCAVIPVRMARSPGIWGIAYSMPAGLLVLLIPALCAARQGVAFEAGAWLSKAGVCVALGGICQFPLATICYYEAIRHGEISTVVPLKCLKSIFVVAIVVLCGLEAITRNAVVACGVGVAGAYILTSGGASLPRGGTAGNKKALLLILLACLSWSAGDILIGRAVKTLPPLVVTPLSLGMGMVAYYLWIAAARKASCVVQLSTRDRLCYAAHGVVSFGLGYCAFFLAMKYVGIVKAVIITSTWPMVSFVIGLLLYREKLSSRKVIGVILLLLSVYIVMLGK